MDHTRYRVRLTDEAIKMLRRLGRRYGAKTYHTLRDLIKGLDFEPEKKGEPLRRQLQGLYSLHYSRFRVIYHIDGDEFVNASDLEQLLGSWGERADCEEAIPTCACRAAFEHNCAVNAFDFAHHMLDTTA